MGLFGALTFLQVYHESNAEPLVMRLVDTEFNSVFIAKKASPAKINDYISKNLVFGERLSTSGHLMPRYFLNTVWQVNPELFFDKVSFSENHYATIDRVLESEADIGVVNEMVFQHMLSKNEIDKDQLKVIWKTPPYTDLCWAVQNSLSEQLKIKIQNTFFSLNAKEHPSILEKFNAKAYVPANIEHFLKLRNIAIDQNLL